MIVKIKLRHTSPSTYDVQVRVWQGDYMEFRAGVYPRSKPIHAAITELKAQALSMF